MIMPVDCSSFGGQKRRTCFAVHTSFVRSLIRFFLVDYLSASSQLISFDPFKKRPKNVNLRTIQKIQSTYITSMMLFTSKIKKRSKFCWNFRPNSQPPMGSRVWCALQGLFGSAIPQGRGSLEAANGEFSHETWWCSMIFHRNSQKTMENRHSSGNDS